MWYGTFFDSRVFAKEETKPTTKCVSTAVINTDKNTNIFSLLIILVAVGFIAAGCTSSKETEDNRQIDTSLLDDIPYGIGNDRDMALKFFIAGSIHEEKREFEDAVREYSHALYYDDDPSIFNALSRSFPMP